MNDDIIQSNLETLKHVHKVREYLYKLILQLDKRAQEHDKSKFESPEQEIFGANYRDLAKTEYGTPEYVALLERVKPAITHHYAKNRHHPEHFSSGINEMDLIDVLEMLADWGAATERNKNGNIHKSIESNTKRFDISPQLSQILTNTVNRYF